MDEARQAEFENLRRQFLRGLAQRLVQLDSARDDAGRRAVLHRLAGAAGGYGFAELGQLARLAEQALREAPAGDPALAAETLARLREQMLTLAA